MYILIGIIFSILFIFSFITLKDNRKYKKRIELMDYQISTINRLINKQNQTVEIDQQVKNESDYSMSENGNTTLLFYSKIKNVQDAVIIVDSDDKIKYIGFYKP